MAFKCQDFLYIYFKFYSLNDLRGLYFFDIIIIMVVVFLNGLRADLLKWIEKFLRAGL